MPRLYPRFLYSNPKNTKSGGPFIMHCLQPRLIFQVVKTDNDHINCVSLDDHADAQAESLIRRDAETWLRQQIKSGEISI